MTCPNCDKNKKSGTRGFPKAVVEINNPDKLILFRKIVVPASMGTERDFPATVGKYHNVLLQYEINGDTYLYSSDGIPTQISSDVSELQHQLNQLNIRLTDEIGERISADNDLTDALNAEILARQTGDTTLQTALDTEESERKAADNTLQSHINSEKAARIAADNTLQGNIDTEKEAREAADQTLQTNINTEATTRANADTALGTRITNETTARQNADNTLDGRITTEANTRSAADSALAGDISAEVTRAKAAETALGGRIDDEVTTRAAADTTLDGKITAEATARANADSTLDGKITDEATTRANADTALGTRITDETTARTNADTALGTRIDNEATARANADTAIEGKLNRNVLYDLEMETDANNVTFVEDKINLKTGATTTERDVIPAASTTTAGTISASEYISLVDAEEKITALLEGAVAIDNLPANPTQAQLTAAWKTATGKDELINRASIYDSANQLVHTYYTNVSEWEDSPAGGQITIDQFTNNAAGIIKGSTTDGNVSANLDGTGTVSGWTSLKNTVAGKQDALTAGNNISISGSTISATDTTYSAGTGLSLTGTTFAVDTTTIAQKSDIPTVNNATLTIQKNGSTVKTFTANASTNVTANITVPTKTSDLTNDSNFPVDANYVHTDNNFTTALKNKLDGIAAGAEVNQNAFSNVKVGGTTVAADSKTDTLELVAGSNVTLTPDATNDKVTIAATDTNTTYTFANGTNGFTVTPSGGTAQTVTVTPSIANATTSTAGLMSAADKTKLNGIATGAEVNVQSDWSQTDTTADDYIKNKPTIPTVNNATLTIQKNGTNVQTFTANQSTNVTANITVPTKVTDLTDATNYVAKDGAFYVTGEGSNFSMTGTSQNVYADLKVKGDTQQTTYSGKNLADASAVRNTWQATATVTNSGDGDYTITGTRTKDTSSGVAYFTTGWVDYVANQTYTISFTKVSGTLYNVRLLTEVSGSDTSVYNAGNVTTFSFTPSEAVRAKIAFYISGNTGDTLTVSNIQVENGSTQTAFEPYVGGVPAPNPDYPQEVEVVTGRQVISSCGKNVLGSEWEVGQYSNVDGSKSDNANMVRTKGFVNVSPNTEYILSRDGSGVAMNVLEYDKNQKFLRVNSGASIAAGSAFTTSLDAEYLTMWRSSPGGTAKMQLEKGSTATTYEPYRDQSYEVDLQSLNKNILDASTLSLGYVASNGTISGIQTQGEMHSGFIKVKPNATYTFSIAETTSTYPAWFGIGEYTNDSTSGFIRRDAQTTTTATSCTITTAENCKYIIVSARNLADATKVQLEEGSQATSYIKCAPIELCKIGTYQDYIYKSGDGWKLYKANYKIVLDGVQNNAKFTERMTANNSKYRFRFTNSSALPADFTSGTVAPMYCDKLIGVTMGNTWNSVQGICYNDTGNSMIASIESLQTSTLEQANTWLGSNNLTVYYVLATPTTTTITNPLLVAQLDDLWRNLQSGTNTTNVNVTGDLPAILGVTAFTNTLASAMAGINERMNRLPAIPQITMTTTDPGEGQPLADNHFIAVYSN